MNEVLVGSKHQRWPVRAFLKRLVWRAAGACALGGLFIWRLEDHFIRIDRHDMPLPDLGDEFEGAKIVHISDLHCSPVVLERYLHQCVEAVNRLQPDFVAITGDFVTGPKYYVRRVARVLKHLEPKVATVACLGNHDYGICTPKGFGQSRGMADYVYDQLSRADVFVMLNESRLFRRGEAAIQFVGVEDYWSSAYNPQLAFDVTHKHLPTVALVHNPDAAAEVASHGADWVLAGHTHGVASRKNKLHRKLYPRKEHKYHAGTHELLDDVFLYVNRGLGYSRRVNLNARPEITLFTLRRA